MRVLSGRRIIREILGLVIASTLAAAALGQTADRTPELKKGKTIEGVKFDPDASLLSLTYEQQRVAYRNLRSLVPHGAVAHGSKAQPLKKKLIDLGGLRYEFDGRPRSLDDYLTDTRVAGLLVIKNGRIVAERYGQGNSETGTWVSFSVTKSVLSMLYGVAVKDGSIRSLDDKVTKYLPQLGGSAYDEVSLRNILQMSSGVAWDEGETNPDSDLAKVGRIAATSGLGGVLAYMARLPRKAPAGSVFNYSTGETIVAGAVLRAATGKSLSAYLSEKIWKPAGMEHDAYWMLLGDREMEFGGCCLSATLRDYGRLGLFAMRGGIGADGQRVLPSGWMKDSTTRAPTASDYGYLWWLEGDGRFAASGIFGQYIYVDRREDLVVAIQSLWPEPFTNELAEHRRAFVNAVVKTVSGRRKPKK